MNSINKVKEIGVVCLQETWTSEIEDISPFYIPNYKLFHKGRKCCKHGGLFTYMHERFDVERLNLIFTTSKWEGHCVKISQTEPFINQHIIGNIYKTSYEGLEDFNSFLTEFQDFMNMLSNFGHPSYLCGDFNINLFKKMVQNYTTTIFWKICCLLDLSKNYISTRICDTSSTLIDNICTNEISSQDASRIFVNHISD